MFEKKEGVDNRVNLIIDHCRVFQVDNISRREIKHWGKLSKNNEYIILDKDYGKSKELMRYVLEERKKISIAWIIIIWLVWVIMIVITILIITKAFWWDSKPNTWVIPWAGNSKSITPPIAPVIVKSSTWFTTPPAPVLEPTLGQVPVYSSWAEDIRDNPDYIELNSQFLSLQDTVKTMDKDYQILQFKYDTCNKTTTSIPAPAECKNTIVEKELTQDEKFQMELWRKVYNRCNAAIKLNNESAQLCKDIYAEFLTQ